MKKKCIQITDQQQEKLKAACAKTGLKEAEILRRALDEWFFHQNNISPTQKEWFRKFVDGDWETPQG